MKFSTRRHVGERGCSSSLMSYHGGRVKAPSGPLGAAQSRTPVFCCASLCLLHSSQHAAWLHKTLNAWVSYSRTPKAPTVMVCSGVPLPPVPDSLHQLAAHLPPSSSPPRCLSVICTSEDRVLVRTALHARLNLAASYSGQSVCTCLWVTKRSALIKISICCHREW